MDLIIKLEVWELAGATSKLQSIKDVCNKWDEGVLCYIILNTVVA